LEGGVYAEPYAGGAGAALALLFSERVNRLLLNDADPCVFAMWRSVLERTDEFTKLLIDTPLTVDEWRRQKAVYVAPRDHDPLEVGFATFYLNRTNRSGIISNAGLIGGTGQTGPWKMDARYNRSELPKRIERIALYRKRISFENLDAILFINNVRSVENLFVYLDPPYFSKGKELYLNHYVREDHRNLALFMRRCGEFLWVMSYDRAADIERLYKPFRQVSFSLSYSAYARREGQEVLILGKGLRFPREWRKRLPVEALRAE
jgi:DNA adenine methylase